MASRRRAPGSYRAAQRAARSVERDLLRRVGAQMDQALERAVQDLIVRLKLLPDYAPAARLQALQRSVEIFQAQRNRLIEALERATVAGRRTSFKDVIAVWQEAAKMAAKTVGLPNAALGAVLSPRTTLLAAYENVGGARLFRTLLTRAAQDGYRAVNDALRSGILEGKSFEVLARELRPFVQGAVEGGAGGSATVAAAFRTVRFNATRIAASEIHNARAEAEVQHFAADPLIEAVAWHLSPDRGTLRRPDACDVFAQEDLHGLGPGIFPVDRVPEPVHPFDLCERVPITRSLARANDPKPSPPARIPADGVNVSRGDQLSDAAYTLIQRDVARLLR